MPVIYTSTPANTTVRDRRCWAMQIDLPYVDCEGGVSLDYSPDCTCLNNEPFFYPVAEGDVWDLQTFMTDTVNTPGAIVAGWNDETGNYPYELEIVNCSGNILRGHIDQYASEWLVGYTGTKFVQMARIDFSLFWAQLEAVFCIRIAVYDALTQELLRYVYMPPMRKDSCRRTVEMESELTAYDCIGRYYGECEEFYGSSNFTFNNWRRLSGNLEATGFPITTEQTDRGVVLGKTVQKNSHLRTRGLPEYAALEMTAIFAGSNVSIGGEVWDVLPSVEKNNDSSQLWYIDSIVERTECEFGRECD